MRRCERSWTAAAALRYTGRMRRLVPVLLSLFAACHCGPPAKKTYAIDSHFLFGTATAGHQVETGLHNSDWWQWEQPGPSGHSHIENDQKADDGPDFAHVNADGSPGGHFAQYLAEAKAMGHNSFRMSIEWSRLQPTKDGPYDANAIALYHAVFKACRDNGLEPMVTLHHWAMPIWVHDATDSNAGLGGWPGPAGTAAGKAPIIDAFARFAGDMAKEFGGEVDLWVTLNEPVVEVALTYFLTAFPGPEIAVNLGPARLALVNLAYAHARAYDAIHANDKISARGGGAPAAEVGFAQHIRRFVPNTNSQKDLDAAAQLDYLLNTLMIDAVTSGDADWNGDFKFDGPDEGKGIPALKNRLDWLGVNYYSRYRALNVDLEKDGMKLKGFFQENVTSCNEGQPPYPEGATDVCWEIYPAGLYETLVWARDRYQRPMYVTENGIAEAAVPDVKRAKYTFDHIEAMQKAMAEGAEVRGYLFWSLMDNFEWVKGYRPRFGLLRVDYTDPDRGFTHTRGADAYGDVIKSRGVTAALRDKWK